MSRHGNAPYPDRNADPDLLAGPVSAPDRLSAFTARFRLDVTPEGATTAGVAPGLAILGEGGAPTHIVLRGDPENASPPEGEMLFAARVSWGGASNPLLAALAGKVVLPIDERTAPAAALLLAEHEARRCGAASVLNRLCEVLVVQVLRALIERGTTHPSLLGGLADPRLARALVAIHDDPGRAWTVETLASVAGLSVSRFSQAFSVRVGETPAAYLRRWRLTLARQDLERGGRVQTVARRYGYGSPEALARAYRHEHGTTPLQARLSTTHRPNAPVRE